MTVQEQIETLRTQRAAEWLQTLREDNPDSHAEFVRWITESPHNLEEFLKLDALSRETRTLLRSPEFDRGTLPAGAAPQVLPMRGLARAADRPTLQKQPAWGLRMSIAASLAIAALAGWWMYDSVLSWDRYATGDGQQKTVELADGSMVYLNAQSRLSVRFEDTGRVLRLAQGEAFFTVARDKQRPFQVRAHDAVVEALGTQFNVNARDDNTHVAVVEGKVRVIPGGESGNAGPEKALSAGEAARVTRAGAVERDSPGDVAAAVKWNQPELVFEGASLEEAVQAFNRHRLSKPLRLEGVPAQSHHYTGIFSAADAESFAALLARERDLEIQIQPNEIVIRTK